MKGITSGVILWTPTLVDVLLVGSVQSQLLYITLEDKLYYITNVTNPCHFDSDGLDMAVVPWTWTG